MSTAALRSCLKPPLRNPWVAEDGGESSTSSGQQQPSQHNAPPTLDAPSENIGSSHTHHPHDLLAHQYATPYSSASHILSHPVSYPSHSAIYSSSGAPTVVSARSSHNVGQQLGHGVVHSHTAHSLHSAAHSVPTAAHSVHSVPGTLQQPWVDTQMLWSTPTLPAVGVGGGVFTVGGGRGEGSCLTLPPGVFPQPHLAPHSLHSLHHSGGVGGSSGQASSSGAVGPVGWRTAPIPASYPQGSTSVSDGGRNLVSASENWSRCEKCHYYCFRAAQAAFVVGIVTGFSLLVAGGVFHRQHIAHLQVLVYIGAMVSLVCVVLLVIFCAMNKDHRTRRGAATRFSGPQIVGGDPETVPLRPVESSNPPVIITENLVTHGGRYDVGSMMPAGELIHQSNHSSCIAPLPNHSSCMAAPPPASYSVCCVAPTTQGSCVMSPSSQNMCLLGPTSHSSGSIVGTVSKVHNAAVASPESALHSTAQGAQR
ncbi:hypothetical protein SK128_010392 [Halocaridina rubra]|uniref:Uncharacterized protein n=1 Tax=Halocaridina rubra TaxID=373956 RepID=A0AAN9AAN0_HALRR